MIQAPGPSTTVDGSLDDLLECSICYTPFQRPLQLSCGHSFCSACVDTLCAHERGEADIFGFNPFDNMPNVFPDFAERDFLLNIGRPILPNDLREGLGGVQDANAPRNLVLRDQLFYDEALRRQPRPIRRPFLEMGRLRDDRRVPGIPPIARAVEIKCPECRRPTRVPPEGLPVNYRLQDMISRLNISKGKPNIKKDLLKCECCEEALSNGSFFTCTSETCTNDTRSRLCPTCAIRHHNGHPINEIKVLTEQDIAVSFLNLLLLVQTAKEAISLHTARAHQALEQIETGFNALAAKSKNQLGNIVKNGMNAFVSIAGGLDGQVFTSMDAVQVSIDKAERVANRYELLLNVINECVSQADQKFGEIACEFVEFFRQEGFQSDQIKTEPLDTINEHDIVVLDLERENQLQEEQLRQQQQDLQNQELQFFDVFQRARNEERLRERERGLRNWRGPLHRRLAERDVGGNHARQRRQNERFLRLHGRRDPEAPEEPFHRPRTPPAIIDRERRAIIPYRPHVIPNVAAPGIRNFHNLQPRDDLADAPRDPRLRPAEPQNPPVAPRRVKEEVVTPPGSPPRREEPPARPGTPEQDINDDAVAHRVGRRRRFNQGADVNAPGPSNQSNREIPNREATIRRERRRRYRSPNNDSDEE